VCVCVCVCVCVYVKQSAPKCEFSVVQNLFYIGILFLQPSVVISTDPL